MNKTRCGVIFDMDGVLIDSYEQHRVSWQRMAKEHDVEMTDDQFATTFGKTSRDIIRTFWGDNVTDEQIRQMDDRKEAIFRDLLQEHLPVMPGALELIDDLLASGFKIGIGSSGPAENVRLVTEQMGLVGKLTGVTNAKHVTRGKPDPQVFLLTAEKMGVAPQCCAVVEDAVHGITAARRRHEGDRPDRHRQSPGPPRSRPGGRPPDRSECQPYCRSDRPGPAGLKERRRPVLGQVPRIGRLAILLRYAITAGASLTSSVYAYCSISLFRSEPTFAAVRSRVSRMMSINVGRMFW